MYSQYLAQNLQIVGAQYIVNEKEDKKGLNCILTPGEGRKGAHLFMISKSQIKHKEKKMTAIVQDRTGDRKVHYRQVGLFCENCSLCVFELRCHKSGVSY